LGVKLDAESAASAFGDVDGVARDETKERQVGAGEA
jgi:hypothetical protein